MSKPTFMLFGVTVAAAVIALAGCGRSTESPSAPVPSGTVEQLGEYAEALAELSDADRTLVEKQKVCPVSGEPLGAMGKPYKVTVKDRVVFLCCAGCEAKIKENPEKYLAKLPK
jgi:YHS domain-containing protein